MTRKPLLLLVITVICLLPDTSAFAKGGLFGAGARFAWQNFKKPVLVHESSAASGLGNLDANDFGGPNFGGELQLRPMNRLSVGLSIDMGLTSHTVFPYTGTNNDLESKATCFSFGILLGGKFYVMEPEAEKASLYLHIAAGKYFSKVSNSAADAIDEAAAKESLEKQTEVISGLSAPIVVQFAVGAEYFLSDSFSLGADILGFRMGIAKASVGESAAAGAFSGEHKLLSFSIYSAVTMNFGFSGGGKKKSIEEDDWGVSGSGADGSGAATGEAGGEADGWGSSGTGAAPANDGWGATSGGTGGGDAGWGATPPADTGAPADSGGWEAQPPASEPEPAPSGGGGARRPRPKKSKPAPATPPPPPPGY